MTTRLTHILALWLALLMGGQSFAAAASVMVCRMDGAPMKACPCAPLQGTHQKTGAPTEAVEKGACCDVLEASTAAERAFLPTVVTQWALERAEAPAPLHLPLVAFSDAVQQAPVRTAEVAPQGAIYLRLRQLLI